MLTTNGCAWRVLDHAYLCPPVSFSLPPLRLACRPISSPQGANILVDAQGGIKLADFGASKKLADLASMSVVHAAAADVAADGAGAPHTQTLRHAGAQTQAFAATRSEKKHSAPAAAAAARGGGGGGGELGARGPVVGASNHLQHRSMRGTAYWMAPEVITQAGHGR